MAGALQRRRKKSFALLGVACGALVLASIVARADLAAFIASFSQNLQRRSAQSRLGSLAAAYHKEQNAPREIRQKAPGFVPGHRIAR
jgi:hypothetical protein